MSDLKLLGLRVCNVKVADLDADSAIFMYLIFCLLMTPLLQTWICLNIITSAHLINFLGCHKYHKM